jgi:integrase
LKPKDRAYLVPDGRGLYLKVQPGGARSWLLRYQIAGKVHDLGLGSYPEIGLADARGRALAARRVKAEGRDPLAARRAEREAKRIEDARLITFRDCAARYIDAHAAGWRNAKHAAQWGSTLATYAYPEIGHLPVAAIDTGLMVRVLQPIWTTKPETAGRVRGRIEAILDYAKAIGYRSGENPAAWKGNLAHALPARHKVRTVEHHASLSYAELPAFMAELRARPGRAARCLEFVILTACRTGEAIGATWPEIDEKARLWAIPGRDHKVPLAGAAMALLADLPREGTKLFGGSNMAMAMLLRRMGRGDLTVHGFRSTFATWCKDIGVAAELREMALAHAEGDKVAAAYTSGAEVLDRRRELAERWARFCDGADRGRVVPSCGALERARRRTTDGLIKGLANRLRAVARLWVLLLMTVPALAGTSPSMPDSQLTPGAVADTDPAVVCARGYSRSHRVWHDKIGTLLKYGIPPAEADRYEDDDLVPVCLGGDNARR